MQTQINVVKSCPKVENLMDQEILLGMHYICQTLEMKKVNDSLSVLLTRY